MNNKEEKEGPVTKSIRLTSALIIRNIARHSSSGRRYLTNFMTEKNDSHVKTNALFFDRSLQRYENHLASVALSNVESSRTVAQILYELTHQCS